MDDSLLRQFIRDTLLELRLDPGMMKMLKQAGIASKDMEEGGHHVAEEWLDDLGGTVSPRDRAIVTRFVVRRWPGIMARYHNNTLTAKQTMYNLLDTRFSDLRVYDR